MARKKQDEQHEGSEIDAQVEAAPANEEIAGVAHPDAEAAKQQQIQLQIDDRETPANYSSTARVWGSGEEIYIDFSQQGIRPVAQNAVRLKIDNRIVMNPWAAKRLAMTLGQTIARYEQTYGTLELDEKSRRQGGR